MNNASPELHAWCGEAVAVLEAAREATACGEFSNGKDCARVAHRVLKLHRALATLRATDRDAVDVWARAAPALAAAGRQLFQKPDRIAHDRLAHRLRHVAETLAYAEKELTR